MPRCLVVILDQISKPLMRDWLASGDVQIAPFLSLVSAWNKGIGFSMLTMSQASGPYLLSGLALVIAAVMLVWLFRTAPRPAGPGAGPDHRRRIGQCH